MAFLITTNGLYLAIETKEHYEYDDFSDTDTAYTTKYCWTENEDHAHKYLDKREAEVFLARNEKKVFFKNAEIKKCYL